MGQKQSKDELLYQQVNYGNIDGIKSLRSEGAGLEWIDSEWKTPLIVACMNPGLYNVAKTLIELGANVNAYRPGRHAGTPLHHAAKRGLDQTVKLLLSHGANVLMINDDCQTPLEIARGKGYSNVVRTIEGHVCLFSGWLRELYGPGFLELLAPQLLSRKVWVVVLPCGSRNLKKPFKLELAIYASAQDAQPRLIIPLWKANLEEPNFNLTDPAAIVSDIASKTRVKLAHANESDKQQLQRFCNACKGIPQVTHSTFPVNTQVPAVQATAPPASEDEEVAMAINASLQAAAHEGPPVIDSHPVASTSSANTIDSSNPGNSDIWGASITHKGSDETLQKEGPSGCQAQHIPTQNIIPSVVQSTLKNPSTVSVPSAPPVADAVPDDGPIHYPSIDSSPVDLSSDAVDALLASLDGKIEDNAASSCTICLDAPVEGACVPCGHMAGCMSCLNEIKAKKWGCPVCRANIDQVIRIYAV
ncbi:putative E3 ubiquitin-protein ligase XBAT34 [Olea europaea var. sylvestris]|uniref:putative E3 ubiquitin-protein ligase XBAT34 n=1 Tax=Olea europaea var. sylvestris TaxID=158386 RepID=UPI000C1CE08D|nr:putative E3 ubiquitin-protein ligase XBAT34 [Olea europaea var. sylvestris]XP_022874617.1 putative E3 ubiquitin-protein ligase XBAT34 [Olea europaea var. sylvestris]